MGSSLLAVALLVAAAPLTPALSPRLAPEGEGGRQATGTEASRPWTFSASAYAFLVPHAPDYVNPNVTADHERGLHLEARYNYEALRTGSAWLGWTFAAGEDLALEITPMIGGVFGDVDGVAPGWLLSLSWG